MAATEFDCTVTDRQNLTPTVFELFFTTDKPVSFKAGQFISVIIPKAGPNGRDLRRAYSIASPPEHKNIELCVKLVEDGPGSNFLNNLRPGDHFRAFAPYGDFIQKTPQTRGVVFISTGTGIAPFRSMILSEWFKNNPPKETYLLFGVRSQDELLYTEEFKKNLGTKFITALSRPHAGWSGFTGRVTDYLRSQMPSAFDWKHHDYYLCGSNEMIKEVKIILEEKGIPREFIHSEVYYNNTK